MDQSIVITGIQVILALNCVTAVIQGVAAGANVDSNKRIYCQDVIQFVLAATKLVLNGVGLSLGAALLHWGS